MTANYTVIWDRKALAEFKAILVYLNNQSSIASEIVKLKIFKQLTLIQINPRLAETDKLKSEPNLNFHAFVVFSYRLTYQIVEEQNLIRIVRIRHTSKEPLYY